MFGDYRGPDWRWKSLMLTRPSSSETKNAGSLGSFDALGSGRRRHNNGGRQTNRQSDHGFAIRATLLSLGLGQALTGAWALLWPGSYYREFPFGRGWLEALPAYSEHLVRDLGGLLLATAAVLFVAGLILERRLVLAASASYLLFSVPHAIYHLANLAPYDAADRLANGLVLAATVALPAWVIWAVIRFRPASVARPAATTPGGETARMRMLEPGEGGLWAKLVFRESMRRYGRVMNPMRITAHHPKLLLGSAAMEIATEHSTLVHDRLKHLAEMRAGMIVGCEWCLDFGSSISAALGVSEKDLLELPAYQRSERFSDLEKSVLDYATQLSRSPADVSDQTFEALAAHFSEAQMVELTSIIALENYRARFNWAFGLEGQGFSQGSVCLSAERRAEVERGDGDAM